MTTIKSFAILALSLTVLVNCVSGQVTFPGSCPSPTVVNSFDVPSYLGLWYENRKYPSLFEAGGKCVTANYSLNDDGSVKVVNSQFNILINNQFSLEGRATVVENGRLNVNFPGSPPLPEGQSNYWVLDTDYKSYSVVFSCSPMGSFNMQFAWILTRQQIPNQNVIDKALNVFKINNISVTQLYITDQINC